MFSVADFRSMKFLKNYYLVFCVLMLLVGGCQPKVYLMPPPIGIDPEGYESEKSILLHLI